MKKILIPHEIAEECFLLEALHWAAFNIYPITTYSLDGGEGRRDSNYHDGDAKLPDSDEFYAYFTKDRCLELGLSPCPITEFFEQHKGFRLNVERSKQDFELLKRLSNIDKKTLDNAKKDYIAALKHEAEWAPKERAWKEEIRAFLEAPKSKLFLALKNNDIRVVGRKNAYLRQNAPLHTWQNEDAWEYDEDGYPDFSEIPHDFWRADGIVWDESRARSPMGEYIHIILNTKDLFKLFPETKSKETYVKSVMHNFVLDKNDQIDSHLKPTSKLGRPSYEWDIFTQALVTLLLKKPLPNKLDNLVSDMGDWCLSNWGQRPGRSTLIEKISPIYKIFKSEIH